jgi:hypothetical protein
MFKKKRQNSVNDWANISMDICHLQKRKYHVEQLLILGTKSNMDLIGANNKICLSMENTFICTVYNWAILFFRTRPLKTPENVIQD